MYDTLSECVWFINPWVRCSKSLSCPYRLFLFFTLLLISAKCERQKMPISGWWLVEAISLYTPIEVWLVHIFILVEVSVLLGYGLLKCRIVESWNYRSQMSILPEKMIHKNDWKYWGSFWDRSPHNLFSFGSSIYILEPFKDLEPIIFM